MTTQPAMYFTSIVPGGPGVLAELTRVRVLRDIEADEGVVVPVGSVGTIVAFWDEGAAYDVEFAKPVAALATVEAHDLQAVSDERPA